MDPVETKDDEVIFEFPGCIKVYKSGKVERLNGTDIVPPTLNSPSNISSKDVTISPEKPVSARLYLPTNIKKDEKLPLLIYFHGGGFSFCTPFCALYHNHLTSLVSKANVVAVSVDYRLAPETPVPEGYEDAWDALKWVALHNSRNGPESWLNDHADFGRVFVAGDSAGANFSHQVALRAGHEKLEGLELYGVCVIHPAFVGKEGAFLKKCWKVVCPGSSVDDDVRINPALDSTLGTLGCTKMLVTVAENDEFELREAGWIYYEALKKSGWKGEVEFHEILGEAHVFHLFKPDSENAKLLLEKMSSFLNQKA